METDADATDATLREPIPIIKSLTNDGLLKITFDKPLVVPD